MIAVEEQIQWLDLVRRGSWRLASDVVVPAFDGAEVAFSIAREAARAAVQEALAPLVEERECALEVATEERDAFARG
jgi:hypothetical protein